MAETANRVIHKYVVVSNKATMRKSGVVGIPENHDILHTGYDTQGNLCIWAEVDKTDSLIDFPFKLLFTGETITEDANELWIHLLTFRASTLIMHLYLNINAIV